MSFAPWGPVMIPPELNGTTLGQTLDLLLLWDMDYLRQRPQTPLLYEANVRYIPEKQGHEVWRSIPFVRQNGGSVCHSLSCWRAAELRVAGIMARPVWSERDLGNGNSLWHVQVLHPPTRKFPEGQLEDPSALLGMNLSPVEVRRYGQHHNVDRLPGVVLHAVGNFIH